MGVAYGVLAAFAFGAGDFAAALAARRSSTLVVVAGAQLVGLLVLLVALAVFQPSAPGLGAGLTAAASGVAGLIGLGALYRGMAMGPMGLVTALAGAGALVPPLVFGAISGAAIGPLQLVGIGFAALAAAVTGGPLGGTIGRAALGLAVAAAASLGAWFVLVDLAARQADPIWVLVVSRATGGLLASALAVGARRRPPALPIPMVAGAGLCDVAGNAFFVLSRSLLHVGIAAALVGLYPIVTMLAARLVLGERLTPRGWSGVGLAVGGIVLISLGAPSS